MKITEIMVLSVAACLLCGCVGTVTRPDGTHYTVNGSQREADAISRDLQRRDQAEKAKAEAEKAAAAAREKRRVEERAKEAAEVEAIETRKREYVAANPNLKPLIRKAILEHKIGLGMTDKDIEAVFGKPYRVNTSVGTYGRHEQWVYYFRNKLGPDGKTMRAVASDTRINRATYMYFENGVLTSYQQ